MVARNDSSPLISGAAQRAGKRNDADGAEEGTVLCRVGCRRGRNFEYADNPHGDVSMLLDSAGKAQVSYGYSAYGQTDDAMTQERDPSDATKVLDPKAAATNPLNLYRYSDKRMDPSSGTLDMGARRFGPDTSHFLQEDLYKDALSDLDLATDPLTQNRYSLAGGNPVSFIEVDGHRPDASQRNRHQHSAMARRAHPRPQETSQSPDSYDRNNPRAQAAPRPAPQAQSSPKGNVFSQTAGVIRDAVGQHAKQTKKVATDSYSRVQENPFLKAFVGDPAHSPSDAALLPLGALGRGVKWGKRGAEAATDATKGLSWAWKTRPRPGADGGISKIGIERSGDDAISQVHKVTVDGKVVHHHQTHIRKYGGQRQFPDQFPGVGSP